MVGHLCGFLLALGDDLCEGDIETVDDSRRRAVFLMPPSRGRRASNARAVTDEIHRNAVRFRAIEYLVDGICGFHSCDHISMIANIQQQSCYKRSFGKVAKAANMDGLESDHLFIVALCKWLKAPPSRVAKDAGLTPTTVLRAYKGTATTRISTPTRDKLQSKYPDFPGWAPDRDPDGEPATPDYVLVRVLPSYAGAGGGGTGEGDREAAQLPRALIEDQLNGRALDFEMIDVRGDSMEPDFHHGDQILIDRRDRDPRQPGPFALWDDDGYVVKLVERLPGKRGWYRVFSANPRYSAYEVEETEATIRGRPVWFARRL